MHDTHPNPSLLATSENRTNGITSGSKVRGSVEGKSYLPAYMLYDEGLNVLVELLSLQFHVNVNSRVTKLHRVHLIHDCVASHCIEVYVFHC